MRVRSLSTMSHAQLFDGADQSANYADFRPNYPERLYSAIFNYAGLDHGDVALDIATGTGQALLPLAARFKRVIAQDGSRSQLANATQLGNVEYSVADAHATGLPDRSVDLVTVAQAMHWFNLCTFYKEVHRVLKPGATFAAWTYDTGCVGSEDSPPNKVFQDLYRSLPWAPERRLVDQRYGGMEPPAHLFDNITRKEYCMETTMRVEPQLMGLIRSWSSIETHFKQHPGQNPLLKFKADILEALGTKDEQTEVTVVRTVSLILARSSMHSYVMRSLQ